MDNQTLLENYLLILKSTVEVYVHGTLESSNSDIKKLLQDNLNETLNHQAKTYNEMTKYGWYQVNNIKASDILNTLNKVENKN